MSIRAAHTGLPDSPATRARFHDPENIFAFRCPAVPRRQFLAERDRAFAAGAPSAEIELDASTTLATSYPATTPLLLARYLRLRDGATLTVHRRASAEVLYVLDGTGVSSGCGESITWNAGDAFCFPGGGDIEHRSTSDTVLFTVTNEPLLAFEALEAPRTGNARVRPLHWPKAAMDTHFAAIFARPDSEQNAGRALQLASADLEPAYQPIPSMNVAINTLEPGSNQRPHRHNGAAITLAIQGQGVYSMIENERVDWVIGAAQVTPAAELHSHHNPGTERMMSLVVQDEGLHFYARTPGFSWE